MLAGMEAAVLGVSLRREHDGDFSVDMMEALWASEGVQLMGRRRIWLERVRRGVCLSARSEVR